MLGAQHGFSAQLAPLGAQVAASAAVGATIEVTSGAAMAAASPSVRTIWRRDTRASDGGGAWAARFSKWIFSS